MSLNSLPLNPADSGSDAKNLTCRACSWVVPFIANLGNWPFGKRIARTDRPVLSAITLTMWSYTVYVGWDRV